MTAEDYVKELKRELVRFKRGLADASEVADRIDELIRCRVKQDMDDRLGVQPVLVYPGKE